MMTRTAAAAWRARWRLVNVVTDGEQGGGSPAERLRCLSDLYLSVPAHVQRQADASDAMVRRRRQQLRRKLNAATGS